MADLHVGDVGSDIRLTVVDQDGAAFDLSASTAKFILFRKPTGATLKKTGVTVSGGTMKYVTIAGDLDVPGEWTVQAYVANSSGNWYSTFVTLPVMQNLGVVI